MSVTLTVKKNIKKKDMENSLQKRLVDFAIDVFNLLQKIPCNAGYSVFKFQLIKSSSSSGANYEEAQAGSSRNDFINKILISLKEMRESNFFLRIRYTTFPSPDLESEFKRLIHESDELKKILGSIASKSRKNSK
jgi:four helix bundle protein